LGLDSDEVINLGKCSAADILQFILEKRMKLQENDKDMVVMLHEIVYEVDGVKNSVSSSMVIKGENNRHTAMAKTVGLTLGIAAKFILDGTIKATGLHIPILPEIYEPVLKELEKHGITFTEKID
jgi:saccharopine dehydrogenase (NADP+, L-glutamate forming)